MNRAPTRRTRAIAASAATLVGASLALGVPTIAHAAEGDIPTDALVLQYEFEPDQISGQTIEDVSGNGRDARLVNPAQAGSATGHLAGTSALDLPGGPVGSTTAPYVSLPAGVLDGVGDGLTISAWTSWSGTADYQWLWCLGKDGDHATFLSPNFQTAGGGVRASVKQTRDGGEVGAGNGQNLPADQWVNVVTTLDGSTLSVYLNGRLVSSTEADVDLVAQLAGGTTSGNLGRALWNVHPFYDGAIDDVRIYDQALTAPQVRTLAGDAVPTITSVDETQVTLRTNQGTAPTLPGVAATWSDGITRSAPVAWEELPASTWNTRGQVTVRGTTENGVAVTAVVTVTKPDEMIVDFGQDTGPFMGGASGTLYGVYGPGLPTNNLLEGMNLRTVSTKAQDGPQHPGADALEVVRPVADASDGYVLIYMTDIYRDFPYAVPGNTYDERWADYRQKLITQVEQVAALPAEYQDNIVLNPFNEPEGNMFSGGRYSMSASSWLDDPTVFFQRWDEAYRLIKDRLPNVRISGPGASVLFDQVQGFLQHTVQAGTVPEVMTWHELSNPASIRSSVDRYRGWERNAFAGTDTPDRQLEINLNEYAYNYHTSVPAQMIQWVAALEDKKVDGDIAYWNIDGNLSDSAVQANRANGQWWLLNSYGHMTGNTVAVTPPQPGVSYTVQGVATLDTERQRGQLLFGGGQAGAQAVTMTNVPTSVFGSSAHVQIREIRWTGQIGDSGPPETIAEFDAPIQNGSVSLDFGAGTIPGIDISSAYEVTVTPGAGTTSPSVSPVTFRQSYEAETAPHTGSNYQINGPEGSPSNPAGFYTSGGRNVGGIRGGSDLALNFDVTVPTTGVYDLSVFASALNTASVNSGGPVNAYIRVDNAAEQEIHLPLTYKWVVWDHADTTVQLSAGRHTITLAARSASGSGATQGDAIVDRIELSLANPAYAYILEAENATLGGGADPDYSRSGVSGSGTVALGAGASSTFWVYSERDQVTNLDFATYGGGSAAITVNGIPVGTLGASAQVPAFLSGGINKVVVTGVSGALVLDRLTAGAKVELPSSTYQAEDGVLTGSAAVRNLDLAEGGKAVGTIGGEPGNTSSLSFNRVNVPADGTYAVTVRYSNEEQAPATHYNPDPLARRAQITVNGVSQWVTFPHSFSANEFWELSVPVTLRAGDNQISFRSEEQPNWDGTTYASTTFPGVPLRSKYAPNIDRITVTPFMALAGLSTPRATARVTTANPVSATGWYRDPVVVALTAPSGTKAQYRIDGGAWRTYSSAVTISTNGQHVLEHRLLRSNVVVEGSLGSVQAWVDRTAPRTSAGAVPSNRVGTPRNPVSVTFTGSDATSGVAAVEYRLNDGAWQTVASGTAVPFATVGEYVVGYRTTDQAGNQTASSTTVVVNPDRRPTVSLSSTRVRPGGYLTLSIAGFDRWDVTSVSLGTTPLSQLLTDVNGSGRITVQIPADAATGSRAVTVVGSDGEPLGSVPVTVQR